MLCKDGSCGFKRKNGIPVFRYAVFLEVGKSEQGSGVGVAKTLGIGNCLEGQVAVVGVQTLH